MSNIHVRSIRTIVHDQHHNAFTGACWFQGNLYVAYRQGAAHVCQEGRLVVTRSKNEGQTFDPVAIIRGQYDTRDAHLYQRDEKRLFIAGFEATPDQPAKIFAGGAFSDNGDNWSPWTRYTGTDGWVMWRPTFFRGKHYCVGYDFGKPSSSRIAWFESDDGFDWRFKHVIHEGADQPNETYFEFQADGSLLALARREHASRKPLLLRSRPPYTRWEKSELDLALAGPCLWTVGRHIFISGRWFPNPRVAHTAVFKIVEGKPELQVVLPSGPAFDHSYMAAARRPNNRHRFALSYYSNHVAHPDGSIGQWDHPGVYVVDARFDAEYITSWRRSKLVETGEALAGSACPEAGDASLSWTSIKAAGGDQAYEGMVAEHEFIDGRPGVLFFDTTIDVGPCERGALLLGFDGPVKVWVNGEEVFAGPGANPAIPDSVSVPIKTMHGPNRVTLALDTNDGKAWGFYARFEPAA